MDEKIDNKLVIDCIAGLFYEYDLDEYLGGEALTEDLLESSRIAERRLGKLLQAMGFVSTYQLQDAATKIDDEE